MKLHDDEEASNSLKRQYAARASSMQVSPSVLTLNPQASHRFPLRAAGYSMKVLTRYANVDRQVTNDGLILSPASGGRSPLLTGLARFANPPTGKAVAPCRNSSIRGQKRAAIGYQAARPRLPNY